LRGANAREGSGQGSAAADGRSASAHRWASTTSGVPRCCVSRILDEAWDLGQPRYASKIQGRLMDLDQLVGLGIRVQRMWTAEDCDEEAFPKVAEAALREWHYEEPFDLARLLET